MAAYISVAHLVSVTAVATGTAQKVPATAQTGRLLVKFTNKGANTVWFGDSSGVDNTTGIALPPEGESDTFYVGLDFYFFCLTGPNNVSAYEGK